jgi:hypothetical protein
MKVIALLGLMQNAVCKSNRFAWFLSEVRFIKAIALLGL